MLTTDEFHTAATHASARKADCHKISHLRLLPRVAGSEHVFLFHARRILLLIWGQKPNELVVKKLAMFGCAALVYAHAVKNKIPANSYAGEHGHSNASCLQDVGGGATPKVAGLHSC